jgi:hypothetical protein
VTACPGNELGDWVYTAGCIDESAFSQFNALAANCAPYSLTNKRGSIAGAVVFDGFNVHRNVVGQIQFHATLGGFCVQGCGFLASQFPAGVSGTCAVNPLSMMCECDLATDIGQNTTTSYTYTNGVLQTGMNETYDSCIAVNTLNYRETTDGGIPGVFVLDRR